MDKALWREVKKVAIGVAALGAVEAVVILIVWHLQVPMLLGTLLGCFCAILNFFLTARAIQKNIDKPENEAKLAAMGNYYLRMILIAVIVFASIKLSWLNVYTTVIPLLFPRLVITICGLAAKKDGGESA